MKHKKILIIGAGSMAQPTILSLLKYGNFLPDDVTIITGQSEDKNKAAIVKLLKQNHFDLYTHRVFEKTPLVDLSLQDMVVYAAKPAFFESIAEQYAAYLQPDAEVISIASAVTVDAFKHKWGDNIKVIRTMPHIPCAIYGIYAEDAAARDLTQALFADLGKSFRLKDERDAFHHFAVHASCAPAFIAQFLARLENDEQRQAATFAFRQMAAGKRIEGDKWDKAQQHTITRSVDFYNHWLSTAKLHFGKDAVKVLNPTLLGTLDYLEKTHTLPEAFITQVRSAKGVTNAGLLFMGSPPPDDARFGDGAEIATQKSKAVFYQHVPAEHSIVYAILASVARSKGMTEGSDRAKHPLYLAGDKQFADIKKEGDAILASPPKISR